MDSKTLERLLNLISKGSKDKPYTYVIANGESKYIDFNKLPLVYISNDEPRRENGGGGNHWILFMLMYKRGSEKTKQIVEFFDSLGESFKHYNLDIPPHFDHLKVIENRIKLQPNYSKTCGLYCLYVLYERLKGRSMQQIVRRDFSKYNLRFNDRKMIRFYNNLCLC